MAGGIGTRFWPLSKINKPKQFIDVLGVGESLLQMTFNRFERICPRENIYIVTSNIYTDLVNEQIPNLDPNQIISEPSRRNTAPCIAYANFKIASINPEANIIVAPSDHFIVNEDRFIYTVEKALHAIETNDILITLGIKPTYPNTGYGYIQYKENNDITNFEGVKKVKLFTEKPNYEMAIQFIESGDFLWNSGIFIWSLKSIDKAMQELLPEVYEVFNSGKKFFNTNKEKGFIEEIYTTCPSISIDYGVMEKASNVYVIPSDFGWSDVGTWGALHEVRDKDENNNSIVGKNVMLYDTKDCIINMPKNKMAIMQGLEDLIIVDANNILMICKKSEEQRIKQFVTDIEVEKGTEYL
ncbi:MAG: mannose-1-phosphate guanylyltransferase [Bacteroidetes bacterium]|nr:mannose-1-phosphate guanylyltransferase [Bacteroidota bacterium]